MVVEPDGDLPAPPDAPAAVPASSRRLGCLYKIVVTVIVLVTLYVAVGILLRNKKTYWVPSESNEPTLQVGDRILVDRGADVDNLPRGAMIVYRKALGAGVPVPELVKRVIGLPGESITFEGERVYVNGAALDEPWLPAGMDTRPAPKAMSYGHTCEPADPCVVPPHQYWVMGDNRPKSQDSRYIGPVAADTVVGRVTRIYWPLSHAGTV